MQDISVAALGCLTFNRGLQWYSMDMNVRWIVVDLRLKTFNKG